MIGCKTSAIISSPNCIQFYNIFNQPKSFTMSKYSVQNQTIDILLGWIKSNEIIIPEIQRPFVWKTSKVRGIWII